MSKANIEIIDEKSFSTAVAEEIVATINDCINERGKCSLSLSGGSTPSAIYRLLSRPPLIKEVNWAKVLIFFGDERWVDKESKNSNYLMIQETLLNNVKIPKNNISPINYSLTSAEESAKEYESIMKSTLSCDANGVPIFDIVLLGVGEDGHTASIFPGDEVALGTDRICVSAKRPDGLEAVTMTAKILKNARNVIFILKGQFSDNIYITYSYLLFKTLICIQ
jgi:6-phosphogluconolactonase